MKKKKVLFLINTYFQLITAIQLTLTEYKNYCVDFLISDNSKNYEKIAGNIKELNIINQVFTVKTKSLIIPRKVKEKIKAIVNIVNSSTYIKNNVTIENNYDVFAFHNLDCFSYMLYQEMEKRNHSIEVVRYEEGFSIYLSFNDRVKMEKLCEAFCKLFRRRSVKGAISKVLLYHPEYLTYEMPYIVKKIELLSKSNKELKQLINHIFEYEHFEKKDMKSIIFEECFYADGNPINDYELFCKVCELFPQKQVMIKLHPRNEINRFQNIGIEVMEKSEIPWEVIQMNNNCDDLIFITITSGSVLGTLLYFEESIPTVFLYKLVTGKFALKTNYEKYLMKICDTNLRNNIFVPNSIQELETIIGELKNEKPKLPSD